MTTWASSAVGGRHGRAREQAACWASGGSAQSGKQREGRRAARRRGQSGRLAGLG
jgi:hypothetical protein